MSLEKKYTFARTLVTEVVTITAGQTLSSFFDPGGMQLRGIKFPSNFTTADISFDIRLSPTDSAARVVITDGTTTMPELKLIAASSGKFVSLYPAWLDAPPFIRLVSSIAQVQTVSIQMLFEPIYQGIHN